MRPSLGEYCEGLLVLRGVSYLFEALWEGSDPKVELLDNDLRLRVERVEVVVGSTRRNVADLPLVPPSRVS